MAAPVNLEELQKHRSREDIWIAVHGKVYNVTKFLEKHPGGVEVLLEQAGMDASAAFEDIGHSDHARGLLEEFKVADLDELPEEHLVPRPAARTEATVVTPIVGYNGTVVAATIAVAAILGGIFAYHYLR